MRVFGKRLLFPPVEIYMTDWMTVIKPSTNPAKLKRPTKHSDYSLFRKFGHKTRNGKGIIANLRKK